MHLYLIVPVLHSDNKKEGDPGVELLHGKLWHVTGPTSLKEADKLSFHCVSYIWGTGREENLGSDETGAGNCQFFNCVGCSLHQWKEAGKTASDVLDVFPNLNAMEDALADQQVSGYLKRTALGVLSNITLRNFDPGFPRNRLLASLGALTKEVSWGPPSLSLSDLSEKVMSVCEEVNDYSFIYTSDERDDAPGLRWRPSATQQESIPARPVHLVPIISWGAWGEPFGETQRAYIDAQGLWLNCMIPLRTSDKTSDEATQMLNNWLHGFHGVEIETYEFLPGDGKEQLSVSSWMSKALRKMHFTGCPNPLICKNGYFFSQIEVHDHYDVQLFVAAGVRWVFGAPGIARWKEKGVFRYSAGVFAGQVNSLIVESVLME